MPRVRQYPEETAISDLEKRVATLEGIIRERFAESFGTIPDGSSNVVIAHNLEGTPSSVFLTPRANTLIWRTALGATTFTVNRVGTSGALTFSWMAIP